MTHAKDIPAGEKWCSWCLTTHPVEAFGTRKRGGYNSECREGATQKAREWAKANPARRKEQGSRRDPLKNVVYNLRAKAKALGLDPDDIERRWRAHSGLCDICGNPCRTGRRLAIEHNHATGEFRGFACLDCNLMLGHAHDDPDRLLAGAAYLRKRP